MQELSIQDLHDYANHFNAQISRVRLGMPLDEPLLMPHTYLKEKYPEKYQGYLIYPPVFTYRRLYWVLEHFNQQAKKTKALLKRILQVVGEIIYGDRTRFLGVM